MTLSPDTRFGRYEIRSLLGAGGMGEVYLAQDTSLRRQVAIKLLPAEFTQNKVRLTRFEREAYAASSLNHPNILTIYEIGEEAGNHYIATEYVDGESLRQHMSRAPMELKEVLDVTQQVASALGAAHDAGIVHRDIKPENVMLRRDGFVKVLDFGLAKLAGETAAAQKEDTDAEAPTRTKVINTEPGMVMGTASYMSPEQARGLNVDARTDIWSLGVMLYEMVSGRLPFEGATTTDVLSKILHREPASLLLYSSDVPAELERIVEKVLAKAREERYQLAKDLALDLKRLKQHLEMQGELERSITPEEGVRRTGAQIATAGTAPTASGSAVSAAQTGNAPATHTLSSAEYIISEIKQHKRSAALALAMVVIAVIAAGFSYFRYFGSQSQTISSIVVLPFVNASGDPNTEYISDGISESLIDRLSQLPGLKVIARSSAFKYKGKEVDLQEVSNSLGVEAILSGRVVQRGDQLQVRAELINARDKTQLWGEQYNRQVTDLQAVQEEIAHTISDKLRLRLTGAEEQQLSKRATQNPEAYQHYLNGMFYARKGGFENARKAIEYQNQAVALDPSFAPAWSEMANSYLYLTGNSVLDPKEANPKAKAAVQKALQLDETLAEGHVVLARIKNDEWDWTGAQREIKRAIELNPNLARAHSFYSDYLSKMGRQTEALAEIKRAEDLDPLRVAFKSSEGAILFYDKRYNEAIQQLQFAINFEPDDSYSHSYLAFSFDALQRYEEAVVEFQKVKSIDGETTSNLCYLGATLARSGKRSEAQAILEKLKSTRAYVSPAELAILYAGLGDKDGAIASLEKAYNEHDLQMQAIKVEQGYDSLRTDPRFIELMRKVGLQ